MSMVPTKASSDSLPAHSATQGPQLEQPVSVQLLWPTGAQWTPDSDVDTKASLEVEQRVATPEAIAALRAMRREGGLALQVGSPLWGAEVELFPHLPD